MEEAVIHEPQAKKKGVPTKGTAHRKGSPNSRADNATPTACFRKIATLVAQGTEAAIRKEADFEGDLSRLRALLDVVLSGALTTLLRNSSLLNEDDRTFLRRRGFLPAKAPKEAV